MRMAAPDRVEPASCTTCSPQPLPGRRDLFRAPRRATRRRPSRGSRATASSSISRPTISPKARRASSRSAAARRSIAALTQAAASCGRGVSLSAARRSSWSPTTLARITRSWSRRAMAGAAIVPADAVMLACGGFQGNGAMMREHFGPGGETMRLISPGARFNTGDGIRMALELGADAPATGTACTPSRSIRAAKNSAPVVLVYPYGIVVDETAAASSTRAAGLVHETWEGSRAHLHFKLPGRMAYAILDRRLLRHRRTGSAPSAPRCRRVRADTLAELAQLIGVDAGNLAATVAAYNAACIGDPRNVRRHALRRAGRRAHACSRRSRTGRAPSRAAVPRLAADRRHRVHLRRPRDRRARRACCATARRSPACSPPARSPGISMGPRRTRSRCCARSCSAGSPGARRLKLWQRDRPGRQNFSTHGRSSTSCVQALRGCCSTCR